MPLWEYAFLRYEHSHWKLETEHDEVDWGVCSPLEALNRVGADGWIAYEPTDDHYLLRRPVE